MPLSLIKTNSIAAGNITTALIASGNITPALISSLSGLSVANTAITGRIATSQQPTGAVLQVVSTTKTDTFSTGSQAGTFVDITGLSVNVTPTSSSNKVLIQAYVSVGTTANQLHYFRLMRNSTPICVGDASGSRNQSTFAWYYGASDSISHIGAVHISFLDSPATTSSVTYKIQMCVQNSGGTAYVNRNGGDSDSVVFGTRPTSGITVMEIAA